MIRPSNLNGRNTLARSRRLIVSIETFHRSASSRLVNNESSIVSLRPSICIVRSQAFNAPEGPTKLDSFKNSFNITCEQPYQPDHIYRTELFTAKENRVHFWIKDIDYNDNTGTLKVDIIEVEQPPKEQS